MWFLALSLLACSEYGLELDPKDMDGLEVSDELEGTEDPGAELKVVEFTVPDRVDIVFFGDTSGSMEPELLTMGANVAAVADRIAQNGSDWQIAAVTGPDGCANNGVLTASTPDWQTLFTEGLVVPGGDMVDEWGLANIQAAVTATGPGACNEGLLRPDAALHVVFISDEDDNSPGFDTDLANYWKPYVEGIRNVKDPSATVRLSAVTGPTPSGCDGAEPGYGYVEATQATGGQWISICEDWAAQLDVLADSISTERRFDLPEAAYPDSVEVEVDGEPRADFRYDGDHAAIWFDNEPVYGGEVVTITYEPLF